MSKFLIASSHLLKKHFIRIYQKDIYDVRMTLSPFFVQPQSICMDLSTTLTLTTLIECNYAVVSSHTDFKVRVLVVLDIACVTKCSLSGKTGFYGNKVTYL